MEGEPLPPDVEAKLRELCDTYRLLRAAYAMGRVDGLTEAADYLAIRDPRVTRSALDGIRSLAASVRGEEK